MEGSRRGEFKFRSDARGTKEHGHIAIRVYLGPDSIRKELEASLTRLQTDPRASGRRPP